MLGPRLRVWMRLGETQGWVKSVCFSVCVPVFGGCICEYTVSLEVSGARVPVSASILTAGCKETRNLLALLFCLCRVEG